MDKVEKLWRSVQESGVPVLKLTFAEIEEILGFPIDHAFLSYKKNSLAYGYEVKKYPRRKKQSSFVSGYKKIRYLRIGRGWKLRLRLFCIY